MAEPANFFVRVFCSIRKVGAPIIAVYINILRFILKIKSKKNNKFDHLEKKYAFLFKNQSFA